MRKPYIGTMGWGYDFWKGAFYPGEMQSSEFLKYYSKQFDTVEADSTFYRIPRQQSVLDWKKETSPGFLFSLKFPRVISHIKMLRDCREETTVFLDRVLRLDEKLGPLLLQLPPSFSDDGLVHLREFLSDLPKRHRYAVEVRNSKLLCAELYQVLRENNAALAWVDSASMPEILERTGDFLYVRWEGDRKKVDGKLGRVEVDATARIEAWVGKLKPFLQSGTEVFGYFSKYYSGLPTLDARCFLNFVKKRV